MTLETQVKMLRREVSEMNDNIEEINKSLKTIADVMEAEYVRRE